METQVEERTASDDPSDELDAVIEEARRRTRRRRLRGAAAGLTALAGASAALVVGGDGGPSGPAPSMAPRDVVQQAASRSIAAATSAIALDVEGPGGGWSGRGLIDLSDGRSRVVATASGERSGPQTVIGTRGKGPETTYLSDEFRSGRCWFNPLFPVGFFNGSVSTEEATRLTGSILESTAEGELLRVRGGDREYEIRLAPSTGPPPRRSAAGGMRTWGERDLIDRLTGPIIARVDRNGMIAEVRFSVDASGPRPSPARLAGRGAPGSQVVARLSPAGRALELHRPACLAIA